MLLVLLLEAVYGGHLVLAVTLPQLAHALLHLASDGERESIEMGGGGGALTGALAV